MRFRIGCADPERVDVLQRLSGLNRICIHVERVYKNHFRVHNGLKRFSLFFPLEHTKKYNANFKS